MQQSRLQNVVNREWTKIVCFNFLEIVPKLLMLDIRILGMGRTGHFRRISLTKGFDQNVWMRL